MAAAHVAVDVKKPLEFDAAPEPFRRGATFGKEGMVVSIRDLEYSVPSNVKKGEQAFLLKGVSGFFEPYKMSALMGPSGSGKTTLLDLLAGRKTAGTTTGDIQFAGNKPTKQFLRRYTGYVEQQDTLLPILTVEEMLMYTAELKRPLSEPLAEKRDAVNELLGKLALDVCRHVKIGSTMARGISGGQAKRTNIGIALISNPRVLFLDEPTSGLDSYTSNEVMTVVKSLTKDGTTIIATIHSPTAYAFGLFDKLMMLVRGRVVYFGDISSAVPYVRSQCSSLTDKEYSDRSNDAEWLVDLFTDADRAGKAGGLADAYDASSHKKAALAPLDKVCSEAHTLPSSTQKELAVKSETVTPWYWALWVYIKYRSTHNYRTPEFLATRIFDKIVIGLLVMTLYLGIGNNFAADNLINMAAILFMWSVMPAFGAAAYVPALSLERGLYVRERSDGLYRPITYLINKLLDEVVVAIPVTLVVCAAVFYGVKLQGSFGIFWFGYFSTLCLGIVLAYFFATVSPNMDVANAALPTLVVTWLFFAGFLFRLSAIPAWWYWYSVIDPIRYTWTALMANQFSANDPPFLGTSLLGYYSLDGQDSIRNIGFVWCFFAFFATATWLLLAFKKFQTR